MTDQPAPQPNASDAASQQPANNFSIPQEYSDRGWAEKIKSPDDLWKAFDNAQSLLGKRPAGIPQHDAPDEEWDKFYAAAGRPESPDKYQLSDKIDGLPDGIDLSPFKQKASSILHAAGLNQKQAERVWKQYISEELKSSNEAKTKYEQTQKEMDAEFDKLSKELFGDKYDAASAAAQELIKASVPEQMRGFIADASPKQQVALIAALSAAKTQVDEIKKKYGAEASITSGQQAGGQSIEDTRKELATLRTSQAAKDFLHPEHKKTMARINELVPIVQSYYSNKK